MSQRKWFFGILLGVILAVSAAQLGAAPGFDCQVALKKIFRNEGGFSKDKNDSGNWTGGKVGKGKLVGTAPGGIAGSIYFKYYRDRLHKTMKEGTLADAAVIYDGSYSRPLHLQNIKSQWLGTMFLDTAINCGTGVTGILAARTINVLNGKGEDFPVDPGLSQSEIDWINAYTKNQFWEPGQVDKTKRMLFGKVYQEMRARYYVKIVRHDPKKLRYLPTWLERTYD